MQLRTPCVLVRQIGEHWFVIQGFEDEEYSRWYYRHNGRRFESRKQAVAYADRLVAKMEMPDAAILEDRGADI